MKKKNQLMFNMWVFYVIIIVIFSIIIINEKKYLFLESRIENKLKEYINSNYKELENKVKINKIKYYNNTKEYKIKVESKENKHLYFNVSYKNKEINTTYNNDYQEGGSILNYYRNKFEKELNNNSEIAFTKTLNEYPSNVLEKILNDEIKSLPIYNIKTELKPSSTDINDISSSIMSYKDNIISQEFKPQYYEFDILFEDITKSFKVELLTEELINNYLNDIIYGIINNDINVIQKYQIKYKYLN